MTFWRQVLPAPARQWMRRGFDRPFCPAGEGVRKLGTSCAWAVVVDRLGPGTHVISGGAGRDISFEIELAARRGCKVALFDPSPTGQETVAGLPDLPSNLYYFPSGLAGHSSRFSFAPPASAQEGSFRVAPSGAVAAGGIEFECLGPQDCFARAGMENVELLKLDIEGFEYEFLATLLSSGFRPVQIAVEFHHFLPGISFMKTLTALRQLRNAGYRILHKDQCDYLFVHRRVLEK